jgi:hypothetical protein
MKRFSSTFVLELLSISLAVFCCAGLALAFEPRAHAYVDPGTGLLAVQGIASIGTAIMYFMRRRCVSLPYLEAPRQGHTRTRRE